MRRKRDEYLIDLTRMRVASPDELADLMEKEEWPVYHSEGHRKVGKMNIPTFLRKFG